MRTVPLVLLLLFATGLPACAQVINGETPYDDTMLHRQPPGDRQSSDDHSTTQPSAAAPSRAGPAAADRPASAGDRRD